LLGNVHISMKQFGILASLYIVLLPSACAIGGLRQPHHLKHQKASLFQKLGSLFTTECNDSPPEGGTPAHTQNAYSALWSGKSSFDVKTEVLIAFLWIMMVAIMPLLIVKAERSAITKTQLTLFAMMWVIFLGGIYTFTQLVKFQSIHFSTQRTLTIVECIYLMAQVLTTVGYGDITPVQTEGQIFMAFFVLFSILVMANLVSEVSLMILARSQEYADNLGQLGKEYRTVFVEEVANDQVDDIERGSTCQVLSPGSTATSARTTLAARERSERRATQVTETHHTGFRPISPRGHKSEDVTHSHIPIPQNLSSRVPVHKQWLCKGAPPLAWESLAGAAATYIFFALLGTMFFHFYPGEGKTWFQGMYMSIITLSTVGFGAFTPNTEGGMVFGSFWMLFGSAALVSVVGSFTELCVMMKTRERWQESMINDFNDCLDTMPEKMNEVDFFRFGVKYAKNVSDAECDLICAAYREMADQAGLVDREKTRAIMDGAVAKKNKELKDDREAVKHPSESGVSSSSSAHA